MKDKTIYLQEITKNLIEQIKNNNLPKDPLFSLVLQNDTLLEIPVDFSTKENQKESLNLIKNKIQENNIETIFFTSLAKNKTIETKEEDKFKIDPDKKQIKLTFDNKIFTIKECITILMLTKDNQKKAYTINFEKTLSNEITIDYLEDITPRIKGGAILNLFK